MRSGARVGLDLGDYHQLVAFLVRDYSPAHRRYIDGALPAGGVLFDVGAHVGLISFGVGARRPDMTVHAFEPNPVNAAGWRRNQRLNPVVSAVLTEAGVSDHEGDSSFGVYSDSGSGVIGYSDEYQIKLVTLDAYCERNGIDHIDVLKIDVQGHEIQVLEGSARLLEARAIHTILVEVTLDPSWAVAKCLHAYGYYEHPLPDVGLRGLLGRFLTAPPVDDLVFQHRQAPRSRGRS
jgi:FkbM family methyltransferase